MNRIAGSDTEVAIRNFRFRFVPMLSTAFAILLALMPFVFQAPVVPDLGFLVLLTWRLLRPEIWQAQVALGFGLFADLVAGHPIGQSMLLWTLTFLALDFVDDRLGFRDYMMDWLLAAGAILFHGVGVWYIAYLMGSPTDPLIMLPQLAISVLVYPFVARIVVWLDRWRLAR